MGAKWSRTQFILILWHADHWIVLFLLVNKSDQRIKSLTPVSIRLAIQKQLKWEKFLYSKLDQEIMTTESKTFDTFEIVRFYVLIYYEVKLSGVKLSPASSKSPHLLFISSFSTAENLLVYHACVSIFREKDC